MKRHNTFRSIVRAVAVPPRLKNYAKALSRLRAPVFVRARSGDQHTLIYRGRARPGVYLLSVLYSFAGDGEGALYGLDASGTELFAVRIRHRERYHELVFEVRSGGEFSIHFRPQRPNHDLTVYALGYRRLPVPQEVRAEIAPHHVCAAVASYPQRSELLRDCVRSLLPQVDWLFVYLNNYREVPSYLRTGPSRKKVHFIVDTASTYRAAAKFFWLGKYDCHWLICDDDLIYPDDYAVTMQQSFLRHDGNAVVGVHGTIFKSNVEDYYGSICAKLPFADALPDHQPVHMLGTGTLMLRSTMFDSDDRDRLLAYPTENDEIFALTCRQQNIKLISVQRRKDWIKAHPRMHYGIAHETLMSKSRQQALSGLLQQGSPWPPIVMQRRQPT